MRIPRVYDPQPLQPGAELSLGDSAAQHLGRVLRMKPGDELVLFNGDGSDYSATLAEVSRKQVRARVDECLANDRESSLQIHLGQCLSKGERMDYAVQKSTELGVTRLTPLSSERTEVKLAGDRADKRQRHWQQVAISACEQSYRSRVPEVLPLQSLSQWLRQVDAELKLVLDPRGAEALAPQLGGAPVSLALLIGPEGGLSDEEVAAAVSAGFRPVVLGPRVLRTETAPVVALSVLQYLLGDLQKQK